MKVNWISVSEQVPDTMRQVWTTNIAGQVFAGCYDSIFDTWEYDDSVIAWAEIEFPAPYEPNVEEVSE